AFPTTSGTKQDISPSNEAISFTMLELKNETFVDDTIKIVSNCGYSFLFTRAICISYSKSDTALSPLIIVFQSIFLAYSVSKPEKESTFIFGKCFVNSLIRAILSSTEKILIFLLLL